MKILQTVRCCTRCTCTFDNRRLVAEWQLVEPPHRDNLVENKAYLNVGTRRYLTITTTTVSVVRRYDKFLCCDIELRFLY